MYLYQPGQRLGNVTFNQSHTGGAVMKKLVVGSIVLVLVTLGWGTMSVGEQVPAPRGELRIVDTDPINWVVDYVEHLRAPRGDRQGWAPGAKTGHRVAVAR